jgi:hypothetical protein
LTGSDQPQAVRELLEAPRRQAERLRARLGGAA